MNDKTLLRQRNAEYSVRPTWVEEEKIWRDGRGEQAGRAGMEARPVLYSPLLIKTKLHTCGVNAFARHRALPDDRLSWFVQTVLVTQSFISSDGHENN